MSGQPMFYFVGVRMFVLGWLRTEHHSRLIEINRPPTIHVDHHELHEPEPRARLVRLGGGPDPVVRRLEIRRREVAFRVIVHLPQHLANAHGKKISHAGEHAHTGDAKIYDARKDISFARG